jgi:prevent-host-death family protein
MKSLSAREAKNEFGRLIDLARAEPVTIEKHGRPVVVVMSVEEYERLTVADSVRRAGEETGKGERQ